MRLAFFFGVLPEYFNLFSKILISGVHGTILAWTILLFFCSVVFFRSFTLPDFYHDGK